MRRNEKLSMIDFLTVEALHFHGGKDSLAPEYLGLIRSIHDIRAILAEPEDDDADLEDDPYDARSRRAGNSHPSL